MAEFLETTRSFKRDSGPLKNPKHEAFARARATGRPCAAAYRLAGYPETAPVTTSYALDRRPEVKRRVQELREEMAGELSVTARAIQDNLLEVIDVSIWDFLDISRAGVRLKDIKDIPARLRPLINEFYQDGNGNVRLKLRSKDKAAELLLRTIPGALATTSHDIGLGEFGERLDQMNRRDSSYGAQRAKTIDASPTAPSRLVERDVPKELKVGDRF